jgi:predicted ATPase
MLTTITLRNFKSYLEARLPLASLTVLIGANASGKSNSIEGMRLLSWLAQGQKLSSIQYAVQRGERVVRGKVDDLPYCQGESFELGCEADIPNWSQLKLTLTLRKDGLHITQESVTQPGGNVPLYELLDKAPVGISSDAKVAYNNFSKGKNKPYITCSDQLAIFTQLTSPATFGSHHTESQKVIPDITKQYEQWLSAMLFLDPVPAAMRDYSFPSDQALNGDGANLSAVLYNLWGNDQQSEEEPFRTNRSEILQFVQSLPEQDIHGLSFLKEPRGGVMVQLIETFGGQNRPCDAALLSDGTLRVLAIAGAMLSAQEGSLVIIEEIDNGVHPSRAHRLLERIRAIAERRHLRVLLTTHNPAMLDALPDAAVPDVVFCYRDPINGSSKLVRLEEVPDYPELIAQGTLGQLSTSGLLERFVKQQPNNDRRERAMAWLENMRSGTNE